MHEQRRTIIVGASSGLGAALAHEFARRGDAVALVARRESELRAVAAAIRGRSPKATVVVVVHDARDGEKAAPAWDACERSLGGPIDRIVYCAGVLHAVRVDEFDIGKDVSMVTTNLVGAMAWLDLAAVRFLARKRGQIVGISSVAGERGRIGAPAYGASKAGLTSFLESLRNRLSRHGISVVTVKPGFIDTDMLKGVEGTFGVMPADRCARAIARACERRRQTIFVPGWWRPVLFLVRLIPSVIFRRMSV